VGATSDAAPPPWMMFPRRCSSARYSSIVIVGSRWEGRKTCACRRWRSAETEEVALEGMMVNGLSGYHIFSPCPCAYNGSTHPSLRIQQRPVHIRQHLVNPIQPPRPVLSLPALLQRRPGLFRRRKPQQLQLLPHAPHLRLTLDMRQP
jgi:hypothetical protein